MHWPDDILARAVELGLITLAWIAVAIIGRLLGII
jgi:hypothetical protein